MDCCKFYSPELESELHELFKKVVLTELEREGYRLYIEPLEPPLWRLRWSFYRPDLFGILSKEFESSFVLVECETDPRIKRIKGKLSKIRGSLTIQKKLSERSVLLRLLLIIPSGMLHRVNYSEIRRFWEIWTVNQRGEIIHKIQKIINQNKETERNCEVSRDRIALEEEKHHDQKCLINLECE